MAVTVPGFRDWTERAVALAEECCGGRLVAFLEGGYSLRHLPAANLAILEALAGLPPSFEGDPVGCDVPEGLRERRARRGRGRGVMRARRARLVDRGGGRAGARCPRSRRSSTPTSWSSAAATPGCGRRGRSPRREPNARVVVLEAERCGMGPSGRNGGFLSSLWL